MADILNGDTFQSARCQLAGARTPFKGCICAPVSAREGDQIFQVEGSRISLLLREVPSTNGIASFSLVGPI